MLQLPNPSHRRVRKLKGISKTTHAQKKYFSLMLVPSYTSGKTRSIRIPYITFYVISLTILAIALVIGVLYVQSQFFRRQAYDIGFYLEKTLYAFEEFQELSAEEQARLLEDSVALQSELNEERIRAFLEQQSQHQSYQETLDAIYAYVENLERQLERFEIYRQELLDLLTSHDHIPPVRNMLADMHESQLGIMATLDELSQRHTSQPVLLGNMAEPMTMALSTVSLQNQALPFTNITTAENIFEYIATMEIMIEAKAELYAQLHYEAERMLPHIRSHPTIMPVNRRISSGFGWRQNPMGGRGSEFHHGVDIPAPRGTNIRAAGGGTVSFVGWRNGYGNTVEINHGFGIRTLYAHNSANLVTVGQRVERGDIIARVGSTGRSTGNHVHYEVIVNGTPVNPVNFFLE